MAGSVADLIGSLLSCSEWGGTRRVYFIGCASFVKIGFSDRLERRFTELQNATPHRLEILAVLPGDQELERRLHGRFSPLQHRREWFRREGALAALLDSAPTRAARAAQAPPALVDWAPWLTDFREFQRNPRRQAELREECRLLVLAGRS